MMKNKESEALQMPGDRREALRILGNLLEKHGESGRNVDLNRLSMPRVIANVRLPGVILHKANLQGARLLNANLQEAYLEQANLRGTTFVEANLRKAYLVQADLQEADLREANLQQARLEAANLQGANLEGANLQEADLTDASLHWAKLLGTNLQRAKLRGASLQRAKLLTANLQGADLTDASLQQARLEALNLQGANLEGANLQGASFWNAKSFAFPPGKVSKAQLLHAAFDETTVLPDGRKLTPAALRAELENEADSERRQWHWHLLQELPAEYRYRVQKNETFAPWGKQGRLAAILSWSAGV